MAEIYYRIETVCEVLELSRAQVRRYEQVGLLASADDGERRTPARRYTEEEVRRLRRLRRMQRDLGLNMAGLEVAMHLLEQIEELRRQLNEGGS
jgi:MerR family transcriptional regulator/heat shock protein HspR